MSKLSGKKSAPAPEAPLQARDILSTDYVFSGLPVTLLQAALIVGLGLWLYWPAFHGAWLWDDSMYITHDSLLKASARLWKAWFQPGSFIEYYPLEETVRVIQWQLWHNDTFGYHLTNVVLHLINALLIWRFLSKFRLRLAWIGGLIFAVHPMNVESVAWISELKNTLSLGPFLLAMCSWMDYQESGRKRDYFLALGLFLVAMLCKITMALFPVVILLYAWWKRGRIGWSDLWSSAPFFVISLVLGVVGYFCGAAYVQSHPIYPPPLGGFFSRLALAGQTIVFYFSEFFWPVQPTPSHPQWPVDPPTLLQFLPWPFLGVIGYWFWRKREGWGRHALLGLGFFVINLAPFLGFNTISYMSFTWVYDHLLYLPMIGLIGLLVAAVADVDARLPLSFRPFSTGLFTIGLVLMAFESRAYAAAFTNPETLWSYAVEHNPEAWVAYDDLGKLMLLDGRDEEAKKLFELTLHFRPDFAGGHAGLGTALIQLGRIPEGIEQYRIALAAAPAFPELHNNLGVVLAQTGQLDEALGHFQLAVKLQPDYAEAYNNMGNTYFKMGRLFDAMESYGQALKINPGYAQAYSNLGNVQLKANRPSDAVENLGQALRLDPNSLNAHNLMGQALSQLGRIPEAISQFQASLQIDPNDATAQSALEQLQNPQKIAPSNPKNQPK